MSENDTSRQRWLNPFAFPAETDVRFVLLVVAVIMLAVNLSSFMRYAFASEGTNPFAEAPEFPGVDVSNEEFFAQYWAEAVELSAAALTSLGLPVAFAMAIFLVAALIYYTHPGRIRRRKGLEPLPIHEDPAFYDEIERLSGVARVSPAPAVALGKGLRGQSGQAFGLPGRYVLRLDGGLRLLMRKAPGAFRAIVLHELAHITNRDVGRTYFAQAIWVSTILLAIIPSIFAVGAIFLWNIITRLSTGGLAGLDLNRLFTVNLPTVFGVYLQIGATLAVVALIRASLLRAREVYADWRSALWGAREPLSGILQRQASKPDSGRGRWLWRLHPTARERLAILQEPKRLFRMTPDLPFVVGILLAFVVAGAFLAVLEVMLGVSMAITAIAVRLGDLAQGFSGSPVALSMLYLAQAIIIGAGLLTIVIAVLPIFGLTYLIVGTAGVQIQREAIVEEVAGRNGCVGYLRLLLPAALIPLGLEAGFLIAPLAFLSPRSPTGILMMVPWLILAVGFTWLCLAYARFFSKRVFGSHMGVSPPTGKRRLLNLSVSGLFCLSYLPLLITRILFIIPGPIEDDIWLLIGWSIFVVILVLFVYGIVFGASWAVVKIVQLISPSRCPSCRQVTRHKRAVGIVCEHCGVDLARWLLTNQPLESMHN